MIIRGASCPRITGRSTAASGDAIDRIEKIIESIESNFVKKMFSTVFFFSWGGLGGRSRSNHFKKFAKANFLKWCRGGVWGGLPPQESPLPVPCPPGGSGGLRPPGISVNYPCLASLGGRTLEDRRQYPKISKTEAKNIAFCGSYPKFRESKNIQNSHHLYKGFSGLNFGYFFILDTVLDIFIIFGYGFGYFH